MVEQVSPVVLPLLPTPSPSAGVPIVERRSRGNAGGPNWAKIQNRADRSTCPGAISAMAASTLLGECPQSGALDPGMLPEHSQWALAPRLA